ncbi:hypothetical protein [Jeotgalibaca arthritidis]|uniref:hypothetical protein n=1 Tax=Jeotgalibaca arthritidis TaxID=1868794 RepID=UPI0035A1213F
MELPRRVYDLKEMAHILGISYHSVRALIDAGAIRPVYLPKEKVTDVELDKFINDLNEDGKKYKQLLTDNNKRVSGKNTH